MGKKKKTVKKTPRKKAVPKGNLRDEIAMRAMHAIMVRTPLGGVNMGGRYGERVESTAEAFCVMAATANGAYGYADAMLKARKK